MISTVWTGPFEEEVFDDDGNWGGNKCDGENRAGIFSSVYHEREWIIDTIDNFVYDYDEHMYQYYHIPNYSPYNYD